MEEFAQLLLLLFAGVLVLNLVQGGPGQVGEWMRAKFLGAED